MNSRSNIASDQDFVRIVTMFGSPEERIVETLSKFYEQEGELFRITKALLGNYFLSQIRDKNILIKPNWVRHSLAENDELCLRTHDSLVLVVLEIILQQHPKEVVIGDAPIQVCEWDKMLGEGFYSKVEELALVYGIPISIKDFRRVTFDPAMNILTKERVPLSEFIIFDVGEKSFLEPLSQGKEPGFRVTQYHPDRMKEAHAKGLHKYCITNELFKADIILSMPKIKTHQKTGITGALKNIVGLNGDKDFLPHHRVGGDGFGGDCYPGKNYFRRTAEYALDNANRNQGKMKYRAWRFLSDVFWRISRPEQVHQLSAGWHGNDTSWRMVLDLNLIAAYGNADGSLAVAPIRKVFSLCDGIIGGQGNGPLYPDPLALGIISFSDNSSFNDICMAHLMGFDTEKIALLRHARHWQGNRNITIDLNGSEVTEENLKEFSIKTTLPPGWKDYLK